MSWCERLESRRLFATVNWDIGISDQSTGQVATPYLAQIQNFVILTGNEWVAMIPRDATAPAETTTLQVSVIIRSENSDGSAGRLSARSISATNVETGGSLFDQAATARVRYGDADDPTSADIELIIDPNYLVSTLWFDPNPAARTETIPTGKIDAYSAILHEMGHAFFFNGFLDSVAYTPISGNDRSVFDSLLTVDGNQPFFRGATAVGVYGGDVPLTRGNLYHLGNQTGAGTDLVPNLMNGALFNVQQRYSIGPLESAMAQDLIAAATRPEEPPPPPPEPKTVTFSGNTQTSYISASGATVLISLKGKGSGQLIFSDNTATQADPISFQVFNTDAKSVLTISTATTVNLPSGLSIGRILGTLNATGINFTGAVTIPGVTTLNLGSVTGTTLTVGTGLKSSLIGIGAVTDSNVTLPAAKTVSVASFSDTGGAAETLAVASSSSSTLSIPGTLSGTLNVTGTAKTVTVGNVSGRMNLSGAVTTLSVPGTLAGTVSASGAVKTLNAGNLTGASVTVNGAASTWKIGGSVTNSQLNLQAISSLSVAGGFTQSVLRSGGKGVGKLLIGGAVTDSTLSADASLGAVTVGSTSGSGFFAGIASGSLPSTYPTSAPGFANAKATIKSFLIKGGSFSDSLIVAPSLGATTLGSVTVVSAGTPFGIFADSIKTVKGATSKDPVLSIKSTSRPFTYDDQDFRLTVV